MMILHTSQSPHLVEQIQKIIGVRAHDLTNKESYPS